MSQNVPLLCHLSLSVSIEQEAHRQPFTGAFTAEGREWWPWCMWRHARSLSQRPPDRLGSMYVWSVAENMVVRGVGRRQLK